MLHLVIGPPSLLLVYDNNYAHRISGLTREASNVAVDGSSFVGSVIK